MGLYDFLNTVRTLHCIDYLELLEAELTWDQWVSFRSNPTDFMIYADDALAQKIWAIVEERKRRYEARQARQK